MPVPLVYTGTYMNDHSLSRRQLLKTLGTIAPAGRLIAQGSKAGRIDVHHHHVLPGDGGLRGQKWSPAVSIEAMDRFEITTALVSLSQQTDRIYDGTEKGRSFARAVNEYGAKMGRDYPGRFGLLAGLPLPQVDASLKEIEYAYDTLKADGIGVYTSVGDQYLGDPMFAPIFDELNRRRAKVFIHPIPPKCCHNLVPGISDFATELDFDMTRTVTSLMVNGTLSRCRDITFILAHSGGTLPVLAGRIKDRYPKEKQYMERVPNGVMAELQRLYFEVAHAAFAMPLAALMKFVPPTQILFGTDFSAEPIESTTGPLASFGLSAETLHMINRGNAERLFPRLKA
jgi:predicted TIM-barrel fold metal-dependent hydrolase